MTHVLRADGGRGQRTPARGSRILVVSGGYTESNYFAGMVHAGCVTAVTTRTRAQDPVSLVRYAARLAQHRHETPFDEVWCVVDVDEFDIGAATSAAQRLGVELAVSNPCFELWLLLHFEERTSHLPSCSAAEQRLRAHVRSYVKPRPRFRDFTSGVAAAVARAKELGDGGNPSTGVWRLVERMVEV